MTVIELVRKLVAALESGAIDVADSVAIYEKWLVVSDPEVSQVGLAAWEIPLTGRRIEVFES